MSRPKLAMAAVVVVLLLVWTVRSLVADAGERTPAPSGAASASNGAEPIVAEVAGTPVAAGEVSGIPIGYPQTRAGAVTAAVNWVASFPRLMRLNPLSLQNTLTDLMSEDGSRSGVDEVIADYFELYEELGPEFRERVWIESPLQTLLVEQSETAARVAVWSVVVTGAGPEDETVVSRSGVPTASTWCGSATTGRSMASRSRRGRRRSRPIWRCRRAQPSSSRSIHGHRPSSQT